MQRVLQYAFRLKQDIGQEMYRHINASSSSQTKHPIDTVVSETTRIVMIKHRAWSPLLRGQPILQGRIGPRTKRELTLLLGQIAHILYPFIILGIKRIATVHQTIHYKKLRRGKDRNIRVRDIGQTLIMHCQLHHIRNRTYQTVERNLLTTCLVIQQDTNTTQKTSNAFMINWIFFTNSAQRAQNSFIAKRHQAHKNTKQYTVIIQINEFDALPRNFTRK
mmetsp:Transcript_25944/g.42415  ORF Transcript_25944/g.42415 Transcript_25944/m.42415 type:complete len:220 (-) Transcript_25944:59-718(-)